MQSWGFQAVRDEKTRMLCDSKATFGKSNNVLILLLQNLYKTSIIQLKFEPKLLSCFLVKTTKRILSEKENQTTCKKKKKNLEQENLGEKLKRSYQFPAHLHCKSQLSPLTLKASPSISL